MPQIYQHLLAALVPLKSKWAFGSDCSWSETPEENDLLMSMLIFRSMTETNPESACVCLCVFVFLRHKMEMILFSHFYTTFYG